MACISRHHFAKGICSLFAAQAAVPAVSVAASAPQDGRLRVAHLTDPQFGFGRRPKDPAQRYAADLKRFEREIDVVNDLKPDLAVITGDMVHAAEDLAKDCPRLLERFKVPVVVSPGNHDVGESITRESLDRFRAVFGHDRKALDVKGWRIIVENTQWCMTNEPSLAKERAEYEQWLKAELDRAKGTNGRVIVAGHIPLFADAANEADSWKNIPRNCRFGRMKAYLDAGVRIYLAGHLHHLSMRAWKELTILNPETTSRNNDHRPFGFRLLELETPGDYSYRFVRVDS